MYVKDCTYPIDDVINVPKNVKGTEVSVDSVEIFELLRRRCCDAFEKIYCGI